MLFSFIYFGSFPHLTKYTVKVVDVTRNRAVCILCNCDIVICNYKYIGLCLQLLTQRSRNLCNFQQDRRVFCSKAVGSWMVPG